MAAAAAEEGPKSKGSKEKSDAKSDAARIQREIFRQWGGKPTAYESANGNALETLLEQEHSQVREDLGNTSQRSRDVRDLANLTKSARRNARKKATREGGGHKLLRSKEAGKQAVPGMKDLDSILAARHGGVLALNSVSSYTDQYSPV